MRACEKESGYEATVLVTSQQCSCVPCFISSQAHRSSLMREIAAEQAQPTDIAYQLHILDVHQQHVSHYMHTFFVHFFSLFHYTFNIIF